jgi:hypothetical protein
MPARMMVLALVSSTLLSAIVRAQAGAAPQAELIKVGDPNLSGASLKPYKNAWKVVYAFPGKEPFLVGTWSDELSAIDSNGLHLLKRSQMADYAKYNIVTTM